MGLQSNRQEHHDFTAQDLVFSCYRHVSFTYFSSFASGTMENSVSQGSASRPRLDMQNQCVTKGKNQRCLFNKKEEKSVMGMMKSKNKPVSQEEGPTSNSSKQGKMTQQYVLRQDILQIFTNWHQKGED